MRVALLLAALIAVIGCGSSPAATVTTGATTLKISYWPQGSGVGPAGTWTLRCAPVGGTLPRAAAACQKLAGMKNPFAPIPRDAMCTEQYGGPQVAQIVGAFRGKRVWTKLQRRNGCEIARFKRLAFLVPAFNANA